MNRSTAVMETCPGNALTKYVRLLVGCYRRGEAEDGEIYIKAVTAILSQYPEDIVYSVTSPRIGLPSKSQFLPTPFEVKALCEARMKPLQDAERLRRMREEAEADRPAEISPSDAEQRKAFIAEWRANTLAAFARVDGEEAKLEDMDARKCKGEMRERVREALEAKIERLKANSVATPLSLSPEALKAIGWPNEAGSAI